MKSTEFLGGTPKAPRVIRDCEGDLWVEVEPDRFLCALTPGEAEELWDAYPGGGRSLNDLEYTYGPLTLVSGG